MIFIKKALGVELCNYGLRMALVGGGEKSLRLDACCFVPLPVETIRYSPREENVKNPQAFVAAIREAHNRLLTKNRSIALSLPDSTGRVILMDVDTRFKNNEEGADIIRWKLKKNFPFDINEVHLDYQVLDENDSGATSLLVSLISRQVVTQYEDLFAEAGLEAKCIDFTAFNLYRLFSHRLEMAENAALIAYYDGVITILVFYSGVLSFYRSKEISDGMSGVNRLYREINSSLLVYQDKYPSHTINEVFCMATGDEVETFRSVVAEATGIEPVLLDVERVITSKSDYSIDKKMLHSLTAALGAAVRIF